MKNLLYLAIAFLVLSACSQTSPEEEAAKAAQSYYARLLDNSPEDFLKGKAGADSLPEPYKAQLLKNYQQYMDEMVETHGGIREVRVSENTGYRDTTQNLTYVFLMLCFNDSTQEEVTVPMLNVNGEWKMK